MSTEAPATEPETRMTCMEVWGGSEAVDAAVVLSGLDAWVYSLPYGENAAAGGDVYYVSACATGRINRLLVADISGHGDGVREVAGGLRDLMRRFVNYIDQSRFVGEMNRQFIESSQDSIFATAVVTTFFAPTRIMSVCNAGHPAPLIYRVATGQWSFLDRSLEGRRVSNIPLGIIEQDQYEQFDVELGVGDLVLLFTDSLVEARDPSGVMLEPAGLLKMVIETADAAEPKTLVPKLLAAINERTSGGLRADDVTALLLRVNGTGSHVAFKDKFLAPVRLLKSMGRSLRDGGPVGFPDLHLANIGGAVFAPLGRMWCRRK